MENERLHSDTELEREIEEQLAWDYRIDTSDIQIHVTNGNALVTGTVPSDIIRILVTRNVAAVPGIQSVSNQLEVGQLPRETIYEDMEARIKQMLREDRDIDVSQIRINIVEEGMVILEGETDTYRKKKHIEDIVTSFIGTVGIDNRIVIVPKRNVEDKSIAQVIIANISATEIIKVDTLAVRVENGNATITGSVPTWTAYNAIYEAVAATYGVTHINLKIDIENTF